MLPTCLKECKKHGLTVFVKESKTKSYFRCRKCRVDDITKQRRKNKEVLVEFKGGRCSICGYNKCIDALEFHHRDPTQKDISIGSGYTYSIKKLLEEIEKCDLLCANCHREIHFKLKNIPANPSMVHGPAC